MSSMLPCLDGFAVAGLNIQDEEDPEIAVVEVIEEDNSPVWIHVWIMRGGSRKSMQSEAKSPRIDLFNHGETTVHYQ
eukprot:COSAG02_NODE_25428_length_659_cov_0.987500_2_plen_77_part_00